MQESPSNSHNFMPALATVQRRRRRELLAIQKQDRERQQAQTTEAPLEVEPPAEQPEPPPHPFNEPALWVEGPAASLLSPPTLDDPALYGLAGRVIRSLAPHSEADPVALLLQFIAKWAIVGPPQTC